MIELNSKFPLKRCIYTCFEINLYFYKMQPVLQKYDHSLSLLSGSTSDFVSKVHLKYRVLTNPFDQEE